MTAKDERIAEILHSGIAESRRSRRTRSHSAETTADRLADALDRWHDKFDGEERDAIAFIRQALIEIAEGKR